VDAVGTPSAKARLQLLELGFDRGQHVGVQELAELRITQKLAELGLVDGQRLGPSLGERGVSVVDVVGDETEQQRGRKRRRRGRVHRGDPHRPVAHRP
jgi:Fe2+ transport system protein FeoA